MRKRENEKSKTRNRTPPTAAAVPGERREKREENDDDSGCGARRAETTKKKPYHSPAPGWPRSSAGPSRPAGGFGASFRRPAGSAGCSRRQWRSRLRCLILFFKRESREVRVRKKEKTFFPLSPPKTKKDLNTSHRIRPGTARSPPLRRNRTCRRWASTPECLAREKQSAPRAAGPCRPPSRASSRISRRSGSRRAGRPQCRRPWRPVGDWSRYPSRRR